MSKCQNKLAKEAINLIGKQGGNIYRSQGGELIDYSDSDQGMFFVMYEGNRVAYNIKQLPLLSVPSIFSSPPEYPWISFPYSIVDPNLKTFDGIFGLSNMPPLNASQGPHSIQSQVESYIDNKMESCADLNSFINEGYDITVNKSKTTVTLASSDVRIKTSMPIEIKNRATSEQTYIDALSTAVNVRLGDMHSFAKNIVYNDVTNIKFNLRDVGNNENSFRINVLDDVFSKDDIVIITDDKSQISGKQFEYKFARKNRRPALYYISPDYLQLAGGTQITKNTLLNGMDLQAEDPDEDTLNFDINPAVPLVFDQPQIVFTASVTDGQLSDFQTITVGRT